MAAGLLRHRRAILLGVVAAYLMSGAWHWDHAKYTPRPIAEDAVRVFGPLAPSFLAVLVGMAGLIAVLVARRGEPLDRRPAHAALTGVALIWISVWLVVMGSSSALVAAVAGAAFLVGALIDWLRLLELLHSNRLIEQRESGGVAPAIVGGTFTPIVLYDPSVAGYRDNAKGKPVVAVPANRMAARNRLLVQMVTAIACAFVALPGGVFAAMPFLGEKANIEKPTPNLVGSVWTGRIDYGSGVSYAFTLKIEDAHDGHFSGVMDWGNVAANVDGTYDGNALVFYDRSIRRTNGAQFNLNDRKDVRIVGNEMTGTDKNGRVPLTATRTR